MPEPDVTVYILLTVLIAGDPMDFYLTAPDGSRIHFPINPERVTMQTKARMISFDVINLGSISMSRGREPARFSWESSLPGIGRKGASFVKNWKPPLDLAKQLLGWSNTDTEVRLLVTNTAINHDVCIATFLPDWAGGHGDIEYSITLVEARDLIITTQAQSQVQVQPEPPKRPAPPAPKTYTVKSGDTLYGVTKQVLGDGSRWQELYSANTGVIGKDPNLIKPGQALRIP